MRQIIELNNINTCQHNRARVPSCHTQRSSHPWRNPCLKDHHHYQRVEQRHQHRHVWQQFAGGGQADPFSVLQLVQTALKTFASHLVWRIYSVWISNWDYLLLNLCPGNRHLARFIFPQIFSHVTEHTENHISNYKEWCGLCLTWHCIIYRRRLPNTLWPMGFISNTSE